MNCWMDTNSFPTRSFSQCSLGLQHLIRTSPIGTREVSCTCKWVRNISLFTDLFLVYFCSYMSLFSYNFLILLFYFFFQFKTSSSTQNSTQPVHISQCSMGLQHLNKYYVVLAGKTQKVRLPPHIHHTHVSSAATQDQKVWITQQSYLKRDPTILYPLLNGQ